MTLNVSGQRLVVVEDSIVRATTLRETLKMFGRAGASGVHPRILSPPYRWPCHYGMDTSDRSKLIAANRSVDEIREYLDVGSLVYLELDRRAAVSTPSRSTATASTRRTAPTIPERSGSRRPTSAHDTHRTWADRGAVGGAYHWPPAARSARPGAMYEFRSGRFRRGRPGDPRARGSPARCPGRSGPLPRPCRRSARHAC
jgi:hypothetical protein